MTKWVLLPTLALLLFMPMWCSEPENGIELTIEKAIEMALKNDKNYLVSQLEVKRNKFKVHQNMGFLPTVTLDGTKNLDEKLMEIEIPPFYPGGETTKTTLDFTRNYEFSFQIVQPVYTGGKIWNAFKNAQLDLAIAKEKQQNASKDSILNVKKIFFNILVMQELLKAHLEARDVAQTNLNNILEKYELGMASMYDRMQAELAVSATKPDISRIQKNIEIAMLNLKYMTGIPETTPIIISGELTYTPFSPNDNEFQQKSLINASEIVQMKMELKKSNNLLKMAYGQFMPNINLVASYSYRADKFSLKNLSKNWENYYTINLALSFPIFTGLKTSGEVGEAKVLKKMMGLNYQMLNETVKLQVKDLCMTIREEYENIQTGLKNIETATEGARIARLTYDEGLISILDLNSSNNQVTLARIQYLQALYNYKIAIAELEKISGESIHK